jgi:WXG100 family type VII secretion target
MRLEAFPMSNIPEAPSGALDQLQTAEEGMRYAVGQFNQKEGDFRTILQSVNSSWDAMKASYRGDSSNAFDQGITAWSEQFKVVINRLADMEQKLRETIGAYDAAEEQAKHEGTTFAGGLPTFAI